MSRTGEGQVMRHKSFSIALLIAVFAAAHAHAQGAAVDPLAAFRCE